MDDEIYKHSEIQKVTEEVIAVKTDAINSEATAINTNAPIAVDKTKEQPTEQATLSIGDCIADPNDYSWACEDIKNQDCTDPNRCTGCGGTFFVQNNSNQEIHLRYYYYQNFTTPNFDGWIQNYYVLKPGERFEESVDVDHRWREGGTYKSRVVKIVLTIPGRGCDAYSGAQLDACAIPIDPLPCE